VRKIGNYRLSKDQKRLFFTRQMGLYLGVMPNNDIWVMELDGGTQTNLTNTEDISERLCDISETKLLYHAEDLDKTKPRAERLWVMDTNGSNKIMLAEEGLSALFSTIQFSPSGKVFFTKMVPEIPAPENQKINREAFSVNSDGSDLTRLTKTNDYNERIDDISSTKIALRVQPTTGTDPLYDLWTRNIDGTNPMNLTDSPLSDDGYGQFLDDGTITFLSNRGKSREEYDIYSIYPDGSNLTRLTDNPYCNTQIAIRPKIEEKVGNLKGTLKGTVTIEGGQIELLQGNQIVRTTMSNSSGFFIIENIPLGLYTLKAEKNSYQTAFYQGYLEVKENQTTNIGELILSKIGETGGIMVVIKDGDIYIQNADGTNKRLATEHTEATEKNPSISPDGRYLAYSSNADGDDEIYLLDLTNKLTTKLTNNTASDDYPAFSPGGTHIAYSSNITGDYDICMMDIFGQGTINLTNSPGINETQPSFSPDGRYILFSSSASPSDIYIMNIDGTNRRGLATEETEDTEPVFSPDQSLIAYNSNNNIYTMKIDGLDKKKLTEGTSPKFSPDGNSLAFIYGNTLYRLNLTNYELTELGNGISAISWGVGEVGNPQIAQISQIEPEVITVSALLQSYPNPANNGCYIPFKLKVGSEKLEVRIYNILGQKVRTIEAGQRKAGSYTEAKQDSAIFWDMKNNYGQKVAKGLYFYQLKAGNFKATKAMVVR